MRLPRQLQFPAVILLNAENAFDDAPDGFEPLFVAVLRFNAARIGAQVNEFSERPPGNRSVGVTGYEFIVQSESSHKTPPKYSVFQGFCQPKNTIYADGEKINSILNFFILIF